MTSTEFEAQPVQDLDTGLGIPSEEEAQIPLHKSGVLTDPNATRATNKYEKGDIVNMSLVESGIRYKGTFTVRKARLHKSGDYFEYSLYDSSKEVYLEGAYIRENKLTLEQRRR